MKYHLMSYHFEYSPFMTIKHHFTKIIILLKSTQLHFLDQKLKN